MPFSGFVALDIFDDRLDFDGRLIFLECLLGCVPFPVGRHVGTMAGVGASVLVAGVGASVLVGMGSGVMGGRFGAPDF